jgi:hypothetical protein
VPAANNNNNKDTAPPLALERGSRPPVGDFALACGTRTFGGN